MEKLGINLSQFIFQAINFLVVFLIIEKFVLRPLGKVLEERQKKIDAGLAKEEEAEMRIVDIEKGRQEAMDEVEMKAEKRMKEVVTKAEAKAKEMIEKARTDAQLVLEKAQKQIEADREMMRKESLKEVASLAEVMVKRMFVEGTGVRKGDELRKVYGGRAIDKLKKKK